MDLAKVLRDTCYCMRLQGATKRGIIEEMIDAMVAEGRLKPEQREPSLKCIFEREAKMSTGVQHGVAIPHGKTDAVSGLVTGFALKPEGVDFESIDGQPSRIFVMTVSSALRAGSHMEFLAGISRILNSAAVRERVLAAATRDDLVAALTEAC